MGLEPRQRAFEIMKLTVQLRLIRCLRHDADARTRFVPLRQQVPAHQQRLRNVLLDRDLSPSAESGAPRRVINLPLVFLAPNYATLCYFTSGVESPMANVAAVAYALMLVRPERRVAGFIVAISPLARPELLLALVLGLGFVWHRTHRFPWRIATTSASPAAATLVTPRPVTCTAPAPVPFVTRTVT